MANQPRTRKRVHATIPRRSPDGSAFQNCDICGEMVAIALADMHGCRTKKKELKRFKGITGTQNVVKPIVPWQPRSPFNIFMYNFMRSGDPSPTLFVGRNMQLVNHLGALFICLESFMETNKNGNLIDIDGKGFETWKNMCKEERQPYVTQAGKVDSAYKKDVIEEEKNITEVDDDEADSAMVGKFDQFYEDCEYYETSDDDEPYQSVGFKSLNTIEWEMQQFGTAEQCQLKVED
ncbi:hypothetical protein CRYUN_Cryun09bG0130500 [Craigia yunnanensis]